MATKKKSFDAPATKRDLLQTESKLDDKINSLRNELNGKINNILNGQDEIIKKLDDMRTEKLMLVSRNREHTETINNHEERIVRLEHKVLI